jgi:hypothetical protein
MFNLINIKYKRDGDECVDGDGDGDGDEVGTRCVVLVMVMPSFSSSCLDGVEMLMEIKILEVWRLWSLQGGKCGEDAISLDSSPLYIVVGGLPITPPTLHMT